jgi:hypothetical protein
MFDNYTNFPFLYELSNIKCGYGGMADTLVLGTSVERHEVSSTSIRTKVPMLKLVNMMVLKTIVV